MSQTYQFQTELDTQWGTLQLRIGFNHFFGYRGSLLVPFEAPRVELFDVLYLSNPDATPKDRTWVPFILTSTAFNDYLEGLCWEHLEAEARHEEKLLREEDAL